MGVKAEGMLGVARVNKVSSASLGYPLSVFNKNSTLKLLFFCDQTYRFHEYQFLNWCVSFIKIFYSIPTRTMPSGAPSLMYLVLDIVGNEGMLTSQLASPPILRSVANILLRSVANILRSIAIGATRRQTFRNRRRGVIGSNSGRNRIWRRFRVFWLLSVKVCSWYKTHSKTGLLAGVWYVFILSVPGFQFGPVTVSFKAFSGHKTIMYRLKVGFNIMNNLIQHRGLDCHFILQIVSRYWSIQSVVYCQRWCSSTHIITTRHVENNNQSRGTNYFSNTQIKWGDAHHIHRDTKCEFQPNFCGGPFTFEKTNLFHIK